jgi:hypothetical protein
MNKKKSTLCKHVPCNTLTHSTNEDLFNIKRKGDPEVSYPLSYVRYHWNPEPVCNFHAHPVHQKVSRFFEPRYIGDDFFRAESSLIQSCCRSFIRVICVLTIFWQTWLHILMDKKNSTHCKHVPCNTLTHSTNEDLLNIKRKGDPEVSYPLSYVRYHWNPEPVCNWSNFHVTDMW